MQETIGVQLSVTVSAPPAGRLIDGQPHALEETEGMMS